MSRPSSSAALFFLAFRSARNAAFLRVKRLREPRYLVGFVFAAAYFTLVFARPGGIVSQGRGREAFDAFPPETFSFVLLAASALALAFLAFAWVFRGGSPALSLTEAEAQFLFSAPLPRSAVLHYALLRPQAGLLFSSLMLTLVSGRAASPGGLRTFLGAWLALSAFQFHLQAMAFWKARLEERPLAVRIAVRAVVVLLAVLAVGATVRWLLSLAVALPALPDRSSFLRKVGMLWEGLRPWRSRFVPSVLLYPFRALLAPLFATDAKAFLLALPGAVGIVFANYAWLAWTNVSWEEATLATASARARRRAEKKAAEQGIVLPAERRRGVVPFRLAPRGRPEAALAWKSLLSSGRTRLSSLAGGAVVALLLVGALPAALSRLNSDAVPVSLFFAATIPVLGTTVAVVSAAGRTNDLRGDLLYAAFLKSWPLPSGRLVLGTLAAPWATSVAVGVLGLLGGAAVLAGMALSLGRESIPGAAGWWVAWGAAALLLVPPLVALVLVVQNAAALAFPAWFALLGRRQAGFEQMGVRLLALLGTTVVLAVALVPGALLALPLVLLAREGLGPLVVPLAAALASLPAWGIAALGVRLLGRLWERYDPSAELLS